MTSRAAIRVGVQALAAIALFAQSGRGARAGVAQSASFKREFCYVVSNFQGKAPPSISILAVDPNSGALKKAGQTTVGLKGDQLAALALHPSSKFLYLADSNASGSRLLAFAIDPNSGGLTRTSSPPAPVAPTPLAAAVDHRGKFLYVANQSPKGAHGAISVFAIDERSGQLAAVTGSPFGAGFCASGLVIDPSDRFVYLAGCSVLGKLGAMPALFGFQIDPASGGLTAVGTSPFGVGTSDANQVPSGVAVDPTGKRVFAADELGGSVWIFDVKVGSGALAATPSSPFLVATPALGARPSSLALDATGAALYATLMPSKSSGDGAVSALGVDAAAGALKPLAGSPYKAGKSPVAAAVDPSGRFLYALNRDEAAVSAYRIAADGTLAALAGSPFAIAAEGKAVGQATGLVVAGVR